MDDTEADDFLEELRLHWKANEIEHKQKILDVLRKRLRARELQLATYGPSADPIIGIEVEDLKEEIGKIEIFIAHYQDRPQDVSNDVPETSAEALYNSVKRSIQQIIGQEALDKLLVRLPNHLERIVLLRILVLGDNPRSVAADLDLPQNRIRLAKHRAVQKISNDDALVKLLYKKE